MIQRTQQRIDSNGQSSNFAKLSYKTPVSLTSEAGFPCLSNLVDIQGHTVDLHTSYSSTEVSIVTNFGTNSDWSIGCQGDSTNFFVYYGSSVDPECRYSGISVVRTTDIGPCLVRYSIVPNQGGRHCTISIDKSKVDGPV